jgi:hypothetical protein
MDWESFAGFDGRADETSFAQKPQGLRHAPVRRPRDSQRLLGMKIVRARRHFEDGVRARIGQNDTPRTNAIANGDDLASSIQHDEIEGESQPERVDRRAGNQEQTMTRLGPSAELPPDEPRPVPVGHRERMNERSTALCVDKAPGFSRPVTVL